MKGISFGPFLQRQDLGSWLVAAMGFQCELVATFLYMGSCMKMFCNESTLKTKEQDIARRKVSSGQWSETIWNTFLLKLWIKPFWGMKAGSYIATGPLHATDCPQRVDTLIRVNLRSAKNGVTGFNISLGTSLKHMPNQSKSIQIML